MNISIVTTSYNSEDYIDEFFRRISNLFFDKKIDFEIIVVDDGSTDDSIKKIKNAQLNLNKITLIELARNFGQHQAIRCGLEHATGELIFLIDSDLEEDPECFDSFYKVLKDNDLDIVYGQQKIRRGSFIEKISGDLYYFFLEIFGGFKLPRNAVVSRLMTKEYLDAYLTFKERDFFLGGITNLTGFKQKGIFVVKKRYHKSKYTFSKKFQFLVRTITNYSSRPLYLLFCSGIIIASVALLMSLYLLLLRIFGNIKVSGWLTIALLSWIGIGITIFSNGILAIYIQTIFTEVKRRPTVIIRRIHKIK